MSRESIYMKIIAANMTFVKSCKRNIVATLIEPESSHACLLFISASHCSMRSSFSMAVRRSSTSSAPSSDFA